MKKLFALTIIFALALAACGDTPEEGNNGDNSDVIGIWTANYGTDNKGVITLDIANGTWILTFKDSDSTMNTYNGTWTRDGNTLSCKRPYYSSDATASLSGNKLMLTQSLNTYMGRPKTCELSKSGSSGTGNGNASLKVKNQSFTEITDVIWNNVTFSNNQYENSVKTGTDVINTVGIGSGYIFFKRKSNPITARTRDLINVEKDQQIEFTFMDNTVIVEVNNPTNNGTLGSVQSTVVWWDDAEGEMQPYHLKQSFVGYYKDTFDLLVNSNNNNFNLPKNGTKSIAVGGVNTALLHLKINLVKKAKLSFWYANKYSNATVGATFSINGVEKAKYTTDIDWSFVTYDLEPGENDMIWAKKDGYYSNAYYGYWNYLSLDDILIYYTE